MKNPQLNPFIERNHVGERADEHVAADEHPGFAAQVDDEVVRGTTPIPDEPLRPEFVAAQHRVCALKDAELADLRSLDVDAVSRDPYVTSVLHAVCFLAFPAFFMD